MPAGLAVLAIAQMGVHLMFFLITTGHRIPGPRGSLVIMANLNENMMVHAEPMNLQMQR